MKTANVPSWLEDKENISPIALKKTILIKNSM